MNTDDRARSFHIGLASRHRGRNNRNLSQLAAVVIVAFQFFIAVPALSDEPAGEKQSTDTSDPWRDPNLIRMPPVELKQSVERASVQLPQLEEGKRYGFLLQVRSVSSEPQTIERLHTSCGCVAGFPEMKTVAPGEDFDIRVIVSPKPNTTQLRQLLVALDDKNRQMFAFAVIADVAPLFELDRAILELEQSEAGNHESQHIRGRVRMRNEQLSGKTLWLQIRSISRAKTKVVLRHTVWGDFDIPMRFFRQLHSPVIATSGTAISTQMNRLTVKTTYTLRYLAR